MWQLYPSTEPLPVHTSDSLSDNTGQGGDAGIHEPESVMFDRDDDDEDDDNDDIPSEVELFCWWRPPVVDEPEPEMVDSE